MTHDMQPTDMRRQHARSSGSVSRWLHRDGPENDPLDALAPVEVQGPRGTPALRCTSHDIEPGMTVRVPDPKNALEGATADEIDPKQAETRVVKDAPKDGYYRLAPMTNRSFASHRKHTYEISADTIAHAITNGLFGVVAWP